jgi:hypothetical protein
MRMVWALRVKTQVSVSRSGRRRRLSPPSCGRCLGESALAVVRGFSCVVVGGCQGSGPGWWMCVEAVASRSRAGICFMEWSSCALGLGESLVSPVRQGYQLGWYCLSRGRLTFRPGRRPRMFGAAAVVYEQFSCAAWAMGGWVVRRCGSSSSGGTSGRRSRKVVLVVCLAW